MGQVTAVVSVVERALRLSEKDEAQLNTEYESNDAMTFRPVWARINSAPDITTQVDWWRHEAADHFARSLERGDVQWVKGKFLQMVADQIQHLTKAMTQVTVDDSRVNDGRGPEDAA